MNTVVLIVGSYEIREYGSCGTFFFLVAEKKTKKVLKRTLLTIESATEFVRNL